MQGEGIDTPHIRCTQREPHIVIRLKGFLKGMFYLFIY